MARNAKAKAPPRARKGELHLTCRGRSVDLYARVSGVTCHRTYKGLEIEARAAGWHLSDPAPDGTRDVMCPDCSKPRGLPPRTRNRDEALAGQTRLFELEAS
jgi:hypothetical protein